MSKSTCNPGLVERFARQQLSGAEVAVLEEHLGQCATCQSLLDDSTADHQLWEDVRQLLADDELDTRQLDPLAATARDDAARTARLATDAFAQHGDASTAQLLDLLAPTDDPQMLGRLGPYEVAGVIGAGGMGVVLKCLDRSLNRFIALKALAPHLAGSGAARQRFAREAQAAAAVIHENVIAIHAVSETGPIPYLVMPYERGVSLQKRIQESGALASVEVVRIALQVASGLAAAHRQGLVHRDVKPANILLADGVERVKITDFGLARATDDASLTQSGTLAGTPQYMSPEQARGEPVDARSDLFSLGSVMYAMCVGHAPFRAESTVGVLRRITDVAPSPIHEHNPAIPGWLVRIVDQLHAKSPRDRYPSADALVADLSRCLAHLQQPAREPLPRHLRLREIASGERPPGERPPVGWLPQLRNDWRLAIGAFLAVSAIVSAIAWAIAWATPPTGDGRSEHSTAPRLAGDQQSHSNPTDPTPGSPGDPIRWFDGVGDQLESTHQDLQALEQRIERSPW